MKRIKIVDVQPDMRGIEITGTVTEMSEARVVETRYGPARVARATIQDETGTIQVNLWRDQIDAVKPGEKVVIENAFAKTYRDKIELSIGRDGKIVVVS